ncbi:hypothetical protein F0U44_04580 [Nocardioides humilatus]|uniref:Uncharacterized protein n=1 Tax=Nocardioides humilatus TaxID=2607660 RepID=A0A5B1LLB9_9ACTN|nr:hypothetical protein [Nocardioides humilatus]KAA1421565.1 hypothetical protein F0U44_04580 [Nocardioides humilatus]
MIDHPDPYPREQIDVWPLHEARQELLEEIVSQPGQPTSTRRIMVPVGIAAALLLVVGGAWAAISAGGDSDRKEDSTVAAASVDPTASDPTAPTSDATTAPTTEPTKKPRHPRGIRLNGVRIGKVNSLDECLRTLRQLDGRQAKRYVQLRKLTERGRDGQMRLYVVREDRKLFAVDEHCRWIKVKGSRFGRH